MNTKEKHFRMYPELISAIALPNYDIISVFRNEDGDLITLKGNFKFFVERQIEYNAPGKVLKNVKIWITGKVKPCRFEWECTDGVCIGDDYIYEHSSVLDTVENTRKADYEVKLVVREDLSYEDKDFIENKISFLVDELGMYCHEDGITYSKKPPYKKFEDIPAGVIFYNKLNRYKEYFSVLEYYSYLENDYNGVEKC